MTKREKELIRMFFTYLKNKYDIQELKKILDDPLTHKPTSLINSPTNSLCSSIITLLNKLNPNPFKNNQMLTKSILNNITTNLSKLLIMLIQSLIPQLLIT